MNCFFIKQSIKMNETYGKLNMEQGAQFVEELQKITFRHPEEMTKLQEEFELYVMNCLDKELERLSLLHFYETHITTDSWFSQESSRWSIVNPKIFGLNHRELKDLNEGELNAWIIKFLNTLINENILIFEIPLKEKADIPVEYLGHEEVEKYNRLREEFEKPFEYIDNEEVLEDMLKYIRLFQTSNGHCQVEVRPMRLYASIREIFPEAEWDQQKKIIQKEISHMYECCLYFGLGYSSLKQSIIKRCETYYAEVK
jgi:hypothetical protein